MFIFHVFICFFIHYLCIAAQYYVANCVSWVPRLTLFALWTNWTYEHALGMELIRVVGDLL